MAHPSGPLVERPLRTDHLEPSTKRSYLSPDVHRDDLDDRGRPLARWKVYYSRFMVGWAVVAHTALLLQSVEIYRTKNASGVSLPAFVVYTFSSIIWFIYGVFVLARRNYVIMVSSTLATLLGATIVVGIVLYGDNDNDSNRLASKSTSRVVPLTR